jgi:hypothetical protein
MSALKTKRFIKKPLYVEAVRITRRNFNDVVRWCEGHIRTESSDHPTNPGAKYIKVEVHNPINTRQTKAYVGDWVLKTDRGFKIYTHKAFTDSFDEARRDRSVEAQVQEEMERAG